MEKIDDIKKARELQSQIANCLKNEEDLDAVAILKANSELEIKETRDLINAMKMEVSLQKPGEAHEHIYLALRKTGEFSNRGNSLLFKKRELTENQILFFKICSYIITLATAFIYFPVIKDLQFPKDIMIATPIPFLLVTHVKLKTFLVLNLLFIVAMILTILLLSMPGL